MLDAQWPFTPVVLWVTLIALVGLLILRTVRRDRREYRRFTRYRTTRRRQETLRRWLLESFVTFGSISAILLLLAGAFVAPLLVTVQGWAAVRAVRTTLADNATVATVILTAVIVGVVVLTVVGIVAARKEGEVPTVGNIRAMLPRNRQELVLGTLLSVNAGVVEELAFRLAIPALLYGATASAEAAVIGSVLLFGALHAYQGVAGVIGTAVIGTVFMASYLVSGTILVPIVLHALFDLRTMVLIPVTVYGVHGVDGRAVPYVSLTPRPPR
jgi:membrane protease YdiL (CAAX protease family)